MIENPQPLWLPLLLFALPGIGFAAYALNEAEADEMIAVRHPHAEDMEAYERVLRDAMAGDATLFAREDYVEEAWRIVDPVLKAGSPIYKYQPGEWGPREAGCIVPPGGWHNPQVAKEPAMKAA